jgi:hypothetical protein
MVLHGRPGVGTTVKISLASAPGNATETKIYCVAKLPVVNVRRFGLAAKFKDPLLARNVAGSERVAPIFETDLHRLLFGFILRMMGELWPPPDAVSAL